MTEERNSMFFLSE